MSVCMFVSMYLCLCMYVYVYVMCFEDMKHYIFIHWTQAQHFALLSPPQETAALRDIAYVIHVGHFPGEDETNKDKVTTAPSTSLVSATKECGTTKDERVQDKEERVQDKEERVQGKEDKVFDKAPTSPTSDKNPFDEDENSVNEHDDTNPFSGDNSPFSEDTKNSSNEKIPAGEDLNPFNEDLNSTTESQDGFSQSSPTTPIAVSSSVFPQGSTGSASQKVDIQSVSRKVVKETVSDLFNVAQLDLRLLMEEVTKHKVS